MLEQLSNAITFYCFYTASQTGKTGLTVTLDVFRGSDGSTLVTAGSATEVGDGIYKYQLSSGNTGTESEYLAVFKTTDTTVDFKWIPAMWAVGKAGVEDLDAAVSSRSTYAGGDTSGTTTLLARLTSTRAGLLDNLDATVSSRLATSGYTTPPTAAAIMAAVLDELASNHNTAGTVGKLIQNLDAAVSSRLASAGYTAPPSLASIVAGVWDEVQSGHATTGSFGKYLDVAVSSRSTYAGADTAGTTTLLARLTSGRATNLDNLDSAVSGVAASVWAVSTRTLSSFGTLVTDIWANATRSLTDKAGFSLSSGGAQAIWDALTSALTTAGSVGKLIADNLDAAVSTRLASGSYTAPDNTGVAAIKAKTDNLPADPADESLLEAAIAAVSAPTAAAVADAVWDEQLSGHATTGSAGKALSDAGTGGVDIDAIADAVWDETAADHETAGTMGERMAAAGGWVAPITDGITVSEPVLITFGFGAGYADLDTVGYQLYDADGTPHGSRVTAGIVDLGNGGYQTSITFDEEWQGSLVADTGQDPAVYTDPIPIIVTAGTDPLRNPVPGGYPTGTAGAALGRIGPARVTYLGAVVNNLTIEVIRGDDYTSGRELQFTDENGTWPSLAPSSTSVMLMFADETWDGTIQQAGGQNQIVKFALPAADTELLESGSYPYAVEALIGGTAPVTLMRGSAIVKERIL